MQETPRIHENNLSMKEGENENERREPRSRSNHQRKWKWMPENRNEPGRAQVPVRNAEKWNERPWHRPNERMKKIMKG